MKHMEFEEIDHTADVGIRARGDSLCAVLMAAAQGMLRLMLEDPIVPASTGADRAYETATIAVEARTADELLHAWLSELLFRMTVAHAFPVRFTEVECSEREDGGPARFRVHVAFRSLTERMREDATEIKAVTWHGLHCRRSGDGWVAEVIFDT